MRYRGFSKAPKQSNKKNRLIVKKVKIVWRNSMIAGNPISRSFTKFGVFDRNWESDNFCRCPRPGGEWASNNGQARKYRIVVDDEAKAKRIAEKMNELVGSVSDGSVCMIDFAISTNNGLRSYSSYISDEDIDHLVTKQFRTSM